MTATNEKPAEADTRPEPWQTVELDDETIEQLRRLLFGQRTVPAKN